MTARKPGAWATCACGARMRRSNKYGSCGKCAHKALNAVRCLEYLVRRRARLEGVQPRLEDVQPEPMPRTVRSAMELASVVLDQARDNGHEIDAMLQDEPAAWIGQCSKCEGYLCVDMSESEYAYGRASGPHLCPGTPPVPPADRQDIEDIPYATRSAGHEYAAMTTLGHPGEED